MQGMGLEREKEGVGWGVSVPPSTDPASGRCSPWTQLEGRHVDPGPSGGLRQRGTPMSGGPGPQA